MYFLYVNILNSSYDLPWALLELKQSIEIYQHPGFDPLVSDPEGYQKLDNFITAADFNCCISYLFLPELSEICKRRFIKYICWVYDSPTITLYHPAVHNDCNYIFIFDKAQYQHLTALAIPHLYYLPMGVNITRTGALNIINDDVEKYSCDVSFIGSLYEENAYNTFINALPVELASQLKLYLVRNLCNWSKIKPWPSVSSDVTDFIKNNLSAFDWAHYSMDFDLFLGLLLLSRKLAELDRVTVLNTLAEKFSVDLYTRSSCEHLKNINIHSGVDYYSEMNKIFYLSKINLNITLPSIETGLPQRILDIMGSGGFLLTNYQAEMEDFFTIGKDIEVFRSLDELVDKTAFYLNHEKERLQIAMNGYLKVRDYFSYTQQVQKILTIVEEDLS